MIDYKVTPIGRPNRALIQQLRFDASLNHTRRVNGHKCHAFVVIRPYKLVHIDTCLVNFISKEWTKAYGVLVN